MTLKLNADLEDSILMLSLSHRPNCTVIYTSTNCKLHLNNIVVVIVVVVLPVLSCLFWSECTCIWQRFWCLPCGIVLVDADWLFSFWRRGLVFGFFGWLFGLSQSVIDVNVKLIDTPIWNKTRKCFFSNITA